MIGSRLPKHKKFHYEPRYYDPEKEEREGRGIHFKRNYQKRAAKQRSLLWLIILIGFVVMVIYTLQKIGH